tara:strand:+ start:4701 stop:7835 length:3135 start_codon:yes stop_codon:yes gene_type:complete
MLQTKRQFKAYLLSLFFLGNFGITLNAQEIPTVPVFQTFQHPELDNKPMLRWWFPSADADEALIEKQLQEYYQKGFGGVEIAMVPQHTEFDPRASGWGTEKWNELMKLVLQKAADLPGKFTVDFTISAHWPPSLNTVDPNDRATAQEMSFAYQTAKTGVSTLPLPKQKVKDLGQHDFLFVDEFVAASIAKVKTVKGDDIELDASSLKDVTAFVSKKRNEKTGEYIYTPAGIPENSTFFGDKPKLADKQYQYQIDLPESLYPALTANASGSSLKAGDWVVFAYYQRGTGQLLSGFEMGIINLPMPDGMYALDYYCAAGTQELINYWRAHILNDPELLALLKANGGYIFEDSIEGHYLGPVWSNGLLEQFQLNKTYNLTPFLPEIASSKGSQKHFKISGNTTSNFLDDYHQTLNQLYLKEHVAPLKKWTREFNYNYRAQPYGAYVEVADAAADLDIAEGESLGFFDRDDNFRHIAGGVHVAGKKLVSDEALADLGAGYKLNWKSAVKTLNSNYSTGVNRMVIHGTAYPIEPSGNKDFWPGWHPFQAAFAEPWGPRQAFWSDVEIITNYIARTQAVLQYGKPLVDIAILTGNHDFTTGFNGLLELGYSYDFIGRKTVLYTGMDVQNNVLAPSGPAYQLLVVKDMNSLSNEVFNQLYTNAKAGLPIIFFGALPTVESSSDINALTIFQNVRVVKSEDELSAVINQLGVTPRTAYDKAPLHTATRTDANGNYCFIYNAGDADYKGEVTFQTSGIPYLLDAHSGTITPIYVYQHDQNTTTINLALLPAEAKIIALLDPSVVGKAPVFYTSSTVPIHAGADGNAWAYSTVAGKFNIEKVNGETQTVKLNKPKKNIAFDSWELNIESFGPAQANAKTYTTKVTELHVGEVTLQSWSAMDMPAAELQKAGVDSSAHLSGIGHYTSQFELPTNWSENDGLILQLEHLDDMITAVEINGHQITAIDPLNSQLDISAFVKAGINTITIKTATTLINRLHVSNPNFYWGVSALPPLPDSIKEAMPEGAMPGPPPMKNVFNYGLTKAELVPYVQQKIN